MATTNGKNMPIASYLVLPKAGRMEQMHAALAGLEHCEVILSDNQDVAILLTDTPDEQTEQNLLEKLKTIPHVQSLSMAFGCNVEQAEMDHSFANAAMGGRKASRRRKKGTSSMHQANSSKTSHS